MKQKRVAKIVRKTKETNIELELNLDGSKLILITQPKISPLPWEARWQRRLEKREEFFVMGIHTYRWTKR